MASERQVIDIPLSAGLNTKADSKAMKSPGLAVATDIQFDDLGGIQTRPQFQAITDAAGNTISQIRKLATYRDELLAFSKDKLWSYSSGDGLWVDKGDYLAVKLEEKARFVTTGDQYDCDRAELNGVTFYSWTEDTAAGTTSYVSAVDSATGTVKLVPEALPTNSARCRLIVTKDRVILSYTVSTTSMVLRAYTPATLAYAGTTVITTVGAYDVCKFGVTTILLVVRSATTYKLYSVSEAGSASLLRTRTTTVSAAMSVSFDRVGASTICIAYNSGTTIICDLLDETGADDTVGIGMGTASSATVNQISCAHDGGANFCVFWSSGESSSGTTGSSFHLGQNTLTTAGVSGSSSVVLAGCGLVSSVFYHDGSAYAWCVFTGISSGDLVFQLQNSYFLVRSDGLVCAKAASNVAGGFSVTQGFLPGIDTVSTGVYSFAGQVKRIISLGQGQKGYDAKSLQEVTATFDSNEARRVRVLGDTAYISGGSISQYDGRSLSEVGFYVFPWELSIIPTSGANLNGTYNWKQTYSWYNASGEFERSTTATIYSQAITTNQASMVGVGLKVTAKNGGVGEVAVEFWRQVADAAVGAPFFLVTSKDPSATGDNGYMVNDTSAAAISTFVDDLSDANLISREAFPENGGLTIESLPPPAASIIAATQDRILLAGIPANPNRVVYSRLRGQGEIASFHDALFVDLPADGGKITAIAFLGENLVVFKESAVYSLPGDGLNNNGQGNNYGPGRILTSDVGAVNQESVALTPSGLVFKSSKGWYILTYSWQAQYIGAAVEDFDAESIVSVLVMESQHQVRILTDSRTIVWDYLANQWSEWSVFGDDAVIWNGTHHIVDSTETSLLAQATSHTGAGDLPMLDIETAWIKLGGLQGYKLVRRLLILGEYLGAHDLRVRVAYNYNTTWIDDKSWTVSPTIVNGPLQVQHGPSRPKCQAIKFRITAEEVGDVGSPPVSEALNLTTLSLEVALKQGSFRGLGAAQKQ